MFPLSVVSLVLTAASVPEKACVAFMRCWIGLAQELMGDETEKADRDRSPRIYTMLKDLNLVLVNGGPEEF